MPPNHSCVRLRHTLGHIQKIRKLLVDNFQLLVRFRISTFGDFTMQKYAAEQNITVVNFHFQNLRATYSVIMKGQTRSNCARQINYKSVLSEGRKYTAYYHLCKLISQIKSFLNAIVNH